MQQRHRVMIVSTGSTAARPWGATVLSLGSLSLTAVLVLSACDGQQQEDIAPCGGAGTICRFAGNGDPAFTGDDHAALATSFYWPIDLEFAPDGRPYILDWQNHRVRRIDADHHVHTVFGTDEIGDGPTPGTGDETTAPGVPGTSINLNHPTDIQFLPDGETMILAAWHNHKVRRMDMTSNLAEIVCGRGPGFSGDGGSDTTALLSMPKGIALAPSGDIYVLDTRNLRVRKIAADTGIIQTVVGTGMRGFAGDGADPLTAQFSFQLDGDNPEPGGAVALDGAGRLYIADTENQRIRRVDFGQGIIETVVGDGTVGAGGDGGPAIAAQLAHPRDIEFAPDGRLFIADTENHRVRAVDLATGIIETIAGSGQPGSGGDGGIARDATLHRPFGIAFDAPGDLYIADTLNNVIRRVVKP